MVRIRAAAGALLLLGVCTGCASIVSGTSQSLSVTTASDGADVAGAQCQLENDKGSWFLTTPGSVTVRRSFKDLAVSCSLAEHQTAIQLARSSTKGMVLGNVLIGGAIGVGVDIASGAAYDYPNVIVVDLVRAAPVSGAMPGGSSRAPAVPPPPAAAVEASLQRSGSRLVFVESDAHSGSTIGETTLVVSETTPTQRIYNDGSIVTGIDGRPIKGSAHAAVLYGLGPRELARGGNLSAWFSVVGREPTPATVRVLRRQVKVVSGQRLEATRVAVEGYASRVGLAGGSSADTAYFSGGALVDNATGTVIELNVMSRASAYIVRRELVRIAIAPAP